MSLLTIFLFFMYAWGLGFSFTFFLKNSDNFLERQLMRIGIGLGAFVMLGITLAFLRLPLDWRIFLFFSIAIPIIISIISFIKNKKIEYPKISPTRETIYIAIVLILFLGTFFIYQKGAFSYPWHEDDDSWEHAKAAEYVSVEKTPLETEYGLTFGSVGLMHYLDPYPPAYPILMGILHQTSPSLNWTLKFFNSLIISLGIIFFYFFAKEFTGNKNKALIATFVLAVIPCYFSHFIWALSLSVMLFFPALYCLEKRKDDPKWAFASVIVIAAILVTQTTTALHFGFFVAIYVLVKLVAEKKFDLLLIAAGPLALILSAILWWGPMFFRYKNPSSLLQGLGLLGIGDVVAREANRFYTWKDLIFAPDVNAINNPTGIGYFLFILAVFTLFAIAYIFTIEFRKKQQNDTLLVIFLGLFSFAVLISFIVEQLIFALALLILGLFGLYLLFRNSLAKENSWLVIVVFWLMYSFLSVHGSRLPLRTDFHRSWLIMAIPVALIAGDGMMFLFKLSFFMKLGVFGILELLFIIYKMKIDELNIATLATYGAPFYYSPGWGIVLGVVPIVFIISLFLIRLFKTKSQALASGILVSIVFLLLFTSGYQKYQVNTVPWNYFGGIWSSAEEMRGYLNLKSLGANNQVFSMCVAGDAKLSGFDQLAYFWRDEMGNRYNSYSFNESMDDFWKMLKTKNYAYVVVDGNCARDARFGINKTNETINKLLKSDLFSKAYQTENIVDKQQGMIIFKMADK